MQNIVTGTAGFIGSHLTEKLLEKGENVTGIDNYHNYYSPKIKQHNIKQIKKKAEQTEGNFQFIQGSILKQKHLKKLSKNPRNVYHLAAIAGTRHSTKKPFKYTETNVKGTAQLLKHVKNTDKFILVSSSSIYGNLKTEKLPVKETKNPEPKTPYALSKHQAEQITRMHTKLYDTEHTIIRPFTVYGPRQRPDEVFTKFINQVLENKPVTIYGDGNQTRDFTHVKDTVQGIILAAEKGKGTYNIGTGRRITVNQIIETLQKTMDKKINKKHVEKPEEDAQHTHADITKAKKELGYKPRKNLEQGTKESINWVKKIKTKTQQGIL